MMPSATRPATRSIPGLNAPSRIGTSIGPSTGAMIAASMG